MGGLGGSYFLLIFSQTKTVEMMLSKPIAKQSNRTLSADSSIAQRRAFFAVALCFQEKHDGHCGKLRDSVKLVSFDLQN